jgi:hypothetical protein
MFFIRNKHTNNATNIYFDTILFNIINASCIFACEISNKFLILLIFSSLHSSVYLFNQYNAFST